MMQEKTVATQTVLMLYLWADTRNAVHTADEQRDQALPLARVSLLSQPCLGMECAGSRPGLQQQRGWLPVAGAATATPPRVGVVGPRWAMEHTTSINLLTWGKKKTAQHWEWAPCAPASAPYKASPLASAPFSVQKGAQTQSPQGGLPWNTERPAARLLWGGHLGDGRRCGRGLSLASPSYSVRVSTVTFCDRR